MPSRIVLVLLSSNNAPISADCDGPRSASQPFRTSSALSGADTCGPSTNRAANARTVMANEHLRVNLGESILGNERFGRGLEGCVSASPFADQVMRPSVPHPAFEPQVFRCRRRVRE